MDEKNVILDPAEEKICEPEDSKRNYQLSNSWRKQTEKNWQHQWTIGQSQVARSTCNLRPQKREEKCRENIFNETMAEIVQIA